MSSKSERLAQANKGRREYFANSIKMLKEELDRTETSNWDLWLCQEKMSKLQADFDKFEMKSATLWGGEASEEQKAIFSNENNEVQKMFFQAKSKLCARISLLSAAEKLGKLAVGENDGTQIESVTGTPITTGNSIENAVKKDGGDTLENEVSEVKIADEAEKHTEATTTRVAPEKTLKITMDKFSMANWKHFEKEFEEKVMQNDQIHSDEKFKALVQLCTGTEALCVLQMLEPNGQKAFDKLKEHFGSKYRQTQFFWQKLMCIQHLSAPNAHELISFVKQVDEIYTGLNDNCDAESIVPFVVISKFDQDMNMAWERYMKVLAISFKETEEKGSFMPTWKSLKGFLQDEADILVNIGCRQLENAAKTKSLEAKASDSNYELKASSNAFRPGSPNVQAKSYEAPSNSQLGSEPSRFISVKKVNPFCDCTDKHPLIRCIPFKRLTMLERDTDIQSKGYCVRCLHKEHLGTPCLDPKNNVDCPNCRIKGVKHNSLFCPIAYKNHFTGKE